MRSQAHVRMPVTMPTRPPAPWEKARFRKLEGPILETTEERSDGALVIKGVATAARGPDCAKERVDLDRSWAYFEQRMRRSLEASGGKSVLPLRTQHNPYWVAGYVRKLWRQGDEVWAEAVVLDRKAAQWVREGALRELSIGGTYVSREPQPDGTVKVVFSSRELSIVDAGCVSGCQIKSVQEQPVDFQKTWSEAATALKSAAHALASHLSKDKGALNHMSQPTCQKCAAKAAEANDLIEKTRVLTKAMQDCAASGHPSSYADAQDAGARSIRNPNGFGSYVEPAKAAKSFYSPTPIESAGGLVKHA